ncbi:3-deoxy-D-manno-octulosonic acid kinase [Desulfurispira natronophila]|uniref:3-deoxy-D-manno-octulosonic acid kinase n=1 Tax=Desulfurispira natronophila TaxID=682562 RepID=A0A7W8DG15_9BACT|nr:3-deoxy-D-manno-octulosonic acid kinase [Desulfurispira natronophila]
MTSLKAKSSLTVQTINPGNYIISTVPWQHQVQSQWFDMQWLEKNSGNISSSPGRGNSYIVNLNEGRVLVLRHYLRGGIVERFVHDTYIWAGLHRTRPWKELELTAQLHTMGLPVPEPVAGRVIHYGWKYQADLLTRYIPDTQSLADAITAKATTFSMWHEVGATIARFHNVGLDHVDLNARNILVDKRSHVFLIDFDRCRLRKPHYKWQQSNLHRLRRSLFKLNCYTHWQWKNMLQGYNSNIGA